MPIEVSSSHDEAQNDFKKAIELDPSLKDKLDPLMEQKGATKR
jgi:hypothetical protein